MVSRAGYFEQRGQRSIFFARGTQEAGHTQTWILRLLLLPPLLGIHKKLQAKQIRYYRHDEALGLGCFFEIEGNFFANGFIAQQRPRQYPSVLYDHAVLART